MQTPPPAVHSSRPGILRAALRSGRFPVGSRLPSERKLAESFLVSRATLNLELAELELEGWVRRISARIRIVHESLAVDSPPPNPLDVVGIAVLTDVLPEPSHHVFVGEQLALTTVGHLVRAAEAFSVVQIKPATDWSTLPKQTPRAWLLLDHVLCRMQPTVRRDFFARCVARRIPVVAFGDCLAHEEVANCPVDLVFSDQADGTGLLVAHLRAEGARRILLLEIDALESIVQHWETERRRGYREACARLGLEALPPLATSYGGFGEDPARAFRGRVRLFAGYLMEARRNLGDFDAICCTSDGEVPTVAAACRLVGLDDAILGRLTGFDHYWSPHLVELQWETTPPLATVNRRPNAIAEALIDALHRRMNDPSLPPQRITVPGRLVTQRELTATSA